MFEKDEDYRKARKESKDRITKVIKVWSAREETLHDEGFRKGAEFGYKEGIKTLDDITRAFNREHKKYTDLRIANEWHDLRKNPNDLPNDGELVLANNLLYTESVKFGKDKGFGISWKTDYFELSGVVFWKEIVLPKESE